MVIRTKGKDLEEPFASREAQEDQDDARYVWAQYNRKYYVGKIVKELKDLPGKLQAKIQKGNGGYLAIHFLRDDTFSLVDKKKVEPYGRDEDVDKK